MQIEQSTLAPLHFDVLVRGAVLAHRSCKLALLVDALILWIVRHWYGQELGDIQTLTPMVLWCPLPVVLLLLTARVRLPTCPFVDALIAGSFVFYFC
jgi:hypothetical protein